MNTGTFIADPQANLTTIRDPMLLTEGNFRTIKIIPKKTEPYVKKQSRSIKSLPGKRQKIVQRIRTEIFISVLISSYSAHVRANIYRFFAVFFRRSTSVS